MSRSKSRKQKNNRWKNHFFVLLSLNLIVLLIIFSLIFWPIGEAEYPTPSPLPAGESSEFIVRTTKENLNTLVNAYIEQYTKNSNQEYQLVLDEDVHLTGELPVFSTSVPLSMRFEPLVEDNGDIILKQKSISLGMLELPNQRIMGYVDRYLPMPEWVIVNPSEEEIYIAITEMDIRSNFEIAVETIDLEANNIAIRINVPFETLNLNAAIVK